MRVRVHGARAKAIYRLNVYYPGEHWPRAVYDAGPDRMVSKIVADLMGEHPNCQRVAVCFGNVHLYAVDSLGNRIAD